MNAKYLQNGSGTVRDGRCFSPPIPTGATVSWKMMEKPVYVPDHKRLATHVLAIWDHFDQLDWSDSDFRETPRGRCIAYYADAESIEDLVESAVPAPAWVNPEIPTEIVIAECLISICDQARSHRERDSAGSRENELKFLKSAVWMHRMLTNAWPILNIHISPQTSLDSLPIDKLREETDRLMGEIKTELNRQLDSPWWNNRLRISA